jgi:peptidoglycan/LPS O-acetylase OafA/YrhL
LWTNVAVVGQEVLFLLGLDPVNQTFYWAPTGDASVKAWSHTLVPQAWSLALELYFYLLAPLILRRGFWKVAMFLVLSLAVRLFIISKGPEYDLFLRRFFPAELCLFLLGYFSYLLLPKVKALKSKYLPGLICWIIFFNALLAYKHIDKRYALSVLAVVTCLSMPFIFNVTKDNRLDRFLGNISYPFYVVHFLIVALLDEFVEEYSLWALLLAVFSACLVIYYLIEAPLYRWRQRRLGALSGIVRSCPSYLSRLRGSAGKCLGFS